MAQQTAVYVFLGREGMSSGPSLTFISLPKVFAAMGGVGRLVGVLFFLALGFAALTSCVKERPQSLVLCGRFFCGWSGSQCGRRRGTPLVPS